MLRLVKTDLHPTVQQCVLRMMVDAASLSELSRPEIRAVADELERTRDRLSQLLDKVRDDDL